MKKNNTNNAVIDHIHIKGARANNLKDLELSLPKFKLIVVTGLSGSGKSSLIMDTLYAEGQRRYVESLSSYARQFLHRMKKPEVDFIKGICPAIAIEQKVSSSNARSTVGSLTEIYDYLRLLFARIGKTYSPVSGKPVRKHQVSDVVDYIYSFSAETKILLLAPLVEKYMDRTFKQQLDLLLQKGYTRVYYNGSILFIEDLLEDAKVDLIQFLKDLKTPLLVLIDRVTANQDEENRKRIADSIQTSFYESEGECVVEIIGQKQKLFNNRFELDGIRFIEPTHQLFNYNNPYGACKTCEGYGRVLGIDPGKVIPNEGLSIYEGAVAAWKGEKLSWWKQQLINVADVIDFPIHRPIRELTEAQKELIWTGNEHFHGLNDFFKELEEKTYKIQNRVLLARYRGRTICPNCKGGRLRTEASYVQIVGKNIMDLVLLPIDELSEFFEKLKLSKHDQTIADRILTEVNNRLKVMMEVGLAYLSLDRLSSTLSGGETQRINLTRMLGSNLTNSLYILDEPSIGLHPKDTTNLVRVLKKLKNLGNTVVVVEHEEEIIRNADYIVDIGPGAGIFGGELIFSGPYQKFLENGFESLTADYLTGKKSVSLPENRRKGGNKIKLIGASQHNLKNIDVSIPLQSFTVISGVSGSGKTSLVRHILFPALKRHLGESFSMNRSNLKSLEGDLNLIKQVEMVSQNPIGKSSRSNPITYVKAYDSIRKLMSEQQISKIRGYKPKHFSFNVEGGRCENCKGDGEITVEMQFLADVKLICEDCKGERFKTEVLEVQYKTKNIYDILNLSIEEALVFFKDHKDILRRIKPLFDVGLGYIKLGQPSSTLSGGEAQRVKLASFLIKDKSNDSIFFIFDEPTTGLHFHDIQKLLDALNALVENGHTVVVVEHNLEVIKSADWVIDLGPDGGKTGGHLVFEGPPDKLSKVKNSYTGQFLVEKF
jgi:excinuclease ABC subunit A